MDLPAPGDSFDNDTYVLHEILGEGGHAVVFRATERGAAAREVAIKVLKPEPGGYPAETAARFDREVRALSQLRDPHSLTLYSYGTTTTGVRFLAFEYVPGQDLAELLAVHGRLGPEATVHVLRQVLQSLQEAHGLGLLHRDIKPENIRVYEYLGDPMRVKLLDFGIAKRAIPDGASVTRTGELVGTLRYMSPEQLMNGVLGAPSDIYSLGLVAFEMLSGVDALQGRALGDQFERLKSDHVFAGPAGWGSGLESIVTRMCAREPEARFQSARDVLDALDRLDGSAAAPVGLRPASSTSSASSIQRRPSQPQPVPAANKDPTVLGLRGALAGLAVVLASIAVVVIIASDTDAPDTTPVPAPAQRRALAGFLKSGAAAPPTRPTATEDAEAPVTAPTDGCGQEAPFLGDGKLSHVDGLTESQWTVYVPRGYEPDARHPVVLLFHQDARDGQWLIRQTAFDKLADEKGIVIIAPDDQSPAWRRSDNVASVGQMMRATSETLCIDSARVFAVGHGVGGFAANYLSCRPWLAGIATSSFRLDAAKSLCDPARPIPYMNLAAMESSRIRVDGGTGCDGMVRISLSDSERLWRERNKCTGDRTSSLKVGDEVCWTWDCEQPYVSCHLSGGHGWPGAATPELDLFRCDEDLSPFPATEKIWAFFDSLEPRTDADPPGW